MGRSRTDNQSAVSPARFRRKPRPAAAPDPTTLFPSPFGPNSQPAPPESPEAPQFPSPGTTSTGPATSKSDSPRHRTHPAPEIASPVGQTAEYRPQSAAAEPTVQPETRSAQTYPGRQVAQPSWTDPSQPIGPGYVGAPGYRGGVTAPGDRESAAPHGSRPAYGTPTSHFPPPDQPQSGPASTMPYPQIGYPPGYFDDQVGSSTDPGRRSAPQGAVDAAAERTARRLRRRKSDPAASDPRERRSMRRGNNPADPGAGTWDSRSAQDGARERLGDRAGRVMRDVLAPAGVEPEELARRLPDTLRGMGEQALVAVRKWADPRERELRRRRRTRRRSLRLGTASGVTTAGTVGLVLISAPAWAVIVVGGGAVALVTGTAVTAKKYLQMRKEPLPQATFVPRRLPPLRSAARASIARLVRAERALHGLGAQIARSGRLPEDDLTDTLETAASGSAALHALSEDLVAMERAAEALGPRNSPLADHVQSVAVRLDAGVVEFEGMVAAAARVLAVPESAAIADDLGWAMVHLRDAADRLDGWAQALTDLADDRYRANP
ncbi:phage shock envelope stress response protein PspM [Nocardia huaxiensis]|nr:hypothetical protein [Nocardia huaxiensis]